MTTVFRRYRLFLLLVLLLGVLLLLKPAFGMESVRISKAAFRDMLLVIPPIFVLLGIFDVWVPRETMVRLMGENSGIRGALLALFLGSFAAGPLYAAFPVADMLIRKGVRFSNILIFIGAWSGTKIPMLLFEATAMGWPFMASRLLLNLPAIFVMAHLLDWMLPERDKALAGPETRSPV